MQGESRIHPCRGKAESTHVGGKQNPPMHAQESTHAGGKQESTHGCRRKAESTHAGTGLYLSRGAKSTGKQEATHAGGEQESTHAGGEQESTHAGGEQESAHACRGVTESLGVSDWGVLGTGGHQHRFS